jgi:hypothetical protein
MACAFKHYLAALAGSQVTAILTPPNGLGASPRGPVRYQSSVFFGPSLNSDNAHNFQSFLAAQQTKQGRRKGKW